MFESRVNSAGIQQPLRSLFVQNPGTEPKLQASPDSPPSRAKAFPPPSRPAEEFDEPFEKRGEGLVKPAPGDELAVWPAPVLDSGPGRPTSRTDPLSGGRDASCALAAPLPASC